MSRVAAQAFKVKQGVRTLTSSTIAASPPSLSTDGKIRECFMTPGSKLEVVSDLVRSHSTLGGHRPGAPPERIIPLMQGFRTSALRQAAQDQSTINSFCLPDLVGSTMNDQHGSLQVPLLPDNFRPNRAPDTLHAIESSDAGVPSPAVSIVATHPENVVPAGFGEVVGNEGMDDVAPSAPRLWTVGQAASK